MRVISMMAVIALMGCSEPVELYSPTNEPLKMPSVNEDMDISMSMSPASEPGKLLASIEIKNVGSNPICFLKHSTPDTALGLRAKASGYQVGFTIPDFLEGDHLSLKMTKLASGESIRYTMTLGQYTGTYLKKDGKFVRSLQKWEPLVIQARVDQFDCSTKGGGANSIGYSNEVTINQNLNEFIKFDNR